MIEAMNGFMGVYAMERWQVRSMPRMMVLSLLAHAGVIVLGSSVLSTFPPAESPPVVMVELSEEPMSTLVEEAPAPAVADARAETVVPSPAAPAPRDRAPRPPSANRWMKKLDAALAAVPDAPVKTETGKAGGLPVRHWENEARPRPGDFAPAVAREDGAVLRRRMNELESKVRQAGRGGIRIGSEDEASMMFGGDGSSAGEPIPPWIREMIRKRVRGYLPELEAAYSAAFSRNPGLKGKMLVRFRIGPSGAVQQAESVEFAAGDGPFVKSILDKVRRWTFDPTSGRTVEVLYPFIFVAPS